MSGAALDDAADRCGGVTASFFKELARRTVLVAADADHRALLGGDSCDEFEDYPEDAGQWRMRPGPGIAP